MELTLRRILMKTKKDKPTSSLSLDCPAEASKKSPLRLVVIDAKPKAQEPIKKIHRSALAARLEAMANDLDQQILALSKL